MKTFKNVYTLTYEKFDADFKSIKEFLSSHKPKKILDLGAGFGRTIPLYSEISEVVLVDSSEEMCESLNEKVRLLGKAYQVIQSPSYRLPFADGEFDAVVVAFAALSEMEPLIFTLGEISRVLKTGGAFYSLTTNPNAFKTGSVGVDRAVRSDWPEAISIETIPISGKGKFQFEVQIISRQLSNLSKIFIEQTCPDVRDLKSILESFGFQIASVAGDFDKGLFCESSPLIIVNAIKRLDESQASKVKNSQVCETIYDRMASNYKDMASADTYNVPNWLSKQFLPYKKMYPVILDCACATGNVSSVFDTISLIPGFLFGIDISSEMVRLARNTGRYDSVIQADLAEGFYVFRENYFDFSIATGCLEFIESPNNFLQSVFKASIPGGVLLCTFEQSVNDQDETVFMNVGGKVLKRFLRTKNSVEQLLVTAGWKVEELDMNAGYVSPTTGKAVNYWYCKARKVL